MLTSDSERNHDQDDFNYLGSFDRLGTLDNMIVDASARIKGNAASMFIGKNKNGSISKSQYKHTMEKIFFITTKWCI